MPRNREPDSPVEVPVVRIDPAHVERPLHRSCINPAVCEMDYSDDEREFMLAVERYKRMYRRPFPTSSEILEVAHALGYRKVAEPVPLEALVKVGKQRNAPALVPSAPDSLSQPNKPLGRPPLPAVPCAECDRPILTRNGTGHRRCRRCYMRAWTRIKAGKTTWEAEDAQLRKEVIA